MEELSRPFEGFSEGRELLGNFRIRREIIRMMTILSNQPKVKSSVSDEERHEPMAVSRIIRTFRRASPETCRGTIRSLAEGLLMAGWVEMGLVPNGDGFRHYSISLTNKGQEAFKTLVSSDFQ